MVPLDVKFFIYSFAGVICLISPSVGQDEYEGLYSLTIEHTFDAGLNPTFTRRGTVMVRSLKSGLAEFVEENPLTAAERAQLRDLAASENGMYRIRVSRGSGDEPSIDDKFVYSFLKACTLYESRLSDKLTVHVDQSGNLISTSISTSVPYCTGVAVADSELIEFNSTVDVQQTVAGPAPETQAYIQKIEQEKIEKAKGQQADNRGFFAKYWMYIIPGLLVMVMLQNPGDPNAAQGGGGGGAPARS